MKLFIKRSVKTLLWQPFNKIKNVHTIEQQFLKKLRTVNSNIFPRTCFIYRIRDVRIEHDLRVRNQLEQNHHWRLGSQHLLETVVSSPFQNILRDLFHSTLLYLKYKIHYKKYGITLVLLFREYQLSILLRNILDSQNWRIEGYASYILLLFLMEENINQLQLSKYKHIHVLNFMTSYNLVNINLYMF